MFCETVALLSKGAKGPVDLCSARTEVERRMVDSRKVKVDFSLEDMDLSEFKGKATYEQIKAYVLDESCRKQPFGAWGKLYIMDHPTLGWSDKITNSYGPGMLYQTGREARIMPDGRLEFLEQGGRTVMREGLTGRKFLDLYKLEQTLESADGVTKAEAYVRYGEGNKLVLQADVWGVSEADTERLRAYVREHCGEALVPECISCF